MKISNYLPKKVEPTGEIALSNLRVRTKSILRKLGVETIDQLVTLTATQISEAPNAGQQTLPDIIAFLTQKGKHLSS